MTAIRAPRSMRIGHDVESARLYAEEDRLHRQVRTVAGAWAEAVGDLKRAADGTPLYTKAELQDFWRVALPQVLYDLLNNYNTGVGVAVAEAFLASPEVKSFKERE